MTRSGDGAPTDHATGRPVAVVTGAARGIGAAVVVALAGAGWAVVATDVAGDDPRLPYRLGTRDELEDVAAAGGGSVVPLVADTCDPAALRGAVDEAERRFGGLDAMVAVAGVVGGGVPLWEMEEGALRAVLDIDLLGPVVAARVAVPALLRRPSPRRGRFVAVASTAATRGMPGLAAYGAAKAGVSGLVRGLAADLRGTGITANAISPGSTDTAGLAESARLYGLPSPQDFAIQQPIERLIQPAEIAAAVLWLADAGTGAVTGTTIAVDGGLAL